MLNTNITMQTSSNKKSALSLIATRADAATFTTWRRSFNITHGDVVLEMSLDEAINSAGIQDIVERKFDDAYVGKNSYKTCSTNNRLRDNTK